MSANSKKIPLEKSKEFDRVVAHLVRSGYLGDIKITEEDKRRSKQNATKKIYHCTERLLEKYRDIAFTLTCYPESACDELDIRFENVDDIMSSLGIEVARGNRKLENRLQNYTPTRDRMDRVNDAIAMLKKKPHNGQMLYKVIYMRYIDEEELPVEEICKRLNISKPTYALYRKEAISFISTRLWGTDDSTFTTVCAIFDLLSNINS